MSGIDQELYEAATIDGAHRLRRAWHVTLPGIRPTIAILLILRIPGIVHANFEKILLLYRPITYEVADVIQTYIYRKGAAGRRLDLRHRQRLLPGRSEPDPADHGQHREPPGQRVPVVVKERRRAV